MEFQGENSMELPVELQWILGKIFERISGVIPGGAPRNC